MNELTGNILGDGCFRDKVRSGDTVQVAFRLSNRWRYRTLLVVRVVGCLVGCERLNHPTTMLGIAFIQNKIGSFLAILAAELQRVVCSKPTQCSYLSSLDAVCGGVSALPTKKSRTQEVRAHSISPHRPEPESRGTI